MRSCLAHSEVLMDIILPLAVISAELCWVQVKPASTVQKSTKQV